MKDFFRQHIFKSFCLLLLFKYSNWLAASDILLLQPSVSFYDSNLPIVLINTHGQRIPDGTRITADMDVIDHGPGHTNCIDDDPNNYQGLIGIEIRGSSSTSWPKKQYNIETRDAAGINLNVPLMHLPEENDWILNAPFIDRSFMRNTLIFQLSNEMGLYASRSRFCEVVLNDVYQGIYVLLEKIKRDRNRVDIDAISETDITGDAVTGGYIIKIDKPGDRGFYSSFPPSPGSRKRIYYQYHYPPDDKITQEQETYIQQWMQVFESVMNSDMYSDPVSGYAAYIDVYSFIDFFLLNELAKNVDGYRLSTFLYKDRDSKGGRLHMGPIWDFNLGFGNANYYDGEDTDGWMVAELTAGEAAVRDQWVPPFWWQRLLTDAAFVALLQNRWYTLRSSMLAEDHIFSIIDSTASLLDEAQVRNFEIWAAPGAYGGGFWPVPDVFYSFRSYADELNYLKSWIRSRLAWMDDAVPKLAANHQNGAASHEIRKPFPNPFTEQTTLTLTITSECHVCVRIFNCRGRCVKEIIDAGLSAGEHNLVWNGMNTSGQTVSSGLYIWQINLQDHVVVRKTIYLK